MIFTGFHLNNAKTSLTFHGKSWLFNRNPYNDLLQSPYNWAVSSPTNPLNNQVFFNKTRCDRENLFSTFGSVHHFLCALWPEVFLGKKTAAKKGKSPELTNMTGWNIRMETIGFIHLHSWWVFHCHVSLLGGKICYIWVRMTQNLESNSCSISWSPDPT